MREKKYLRNCPICNDSIGHTTLYHRDKGVEGKSACKKCADIKKTKYNFRKENDLYVKQCPKCNIVNITYTTMQGILWSTNHNVICDLCKEKEKVKKERNNL